MRHGFIRKHQPEEGVMNQVARDALHPVYVERWPSERLLLILVALAAIAIWAGLAVSIIGIVYVGVRSWDLRVEGSGARFKCSLIGIPIHRRSAVED